jgi:hypothetical protein
MSKRKWVLLLLCGLLLIGYIKLFYKTHSEKVVAKTADAVMAIDVKRITNTIIWQFITTPRLWKISTSSKKSDEINWKDIINLPDYILAFHAGGQPANAWYTVLTIKDETLFSKGLQQYHFEKSDSNIYISNELGIQFYKHDKEIVVTTTLVQNTLLKKVADELFVQKAYVAKTELINLLDAKSHVAFTLRANEFLEKDAIVKANFNSNSITIESDVMPKKAFAFSENIFNYHSNTLLSLGFTQPSANFLALLKDSAKSNINKAININIDSFLLPSNKYYCLDIASIKPRVDSAISYTYDDDFNKIEKVVVNNIEEPSFNFSIVGDSVAAVYNNWLSAGKLEEMTAGKWFLPMPFVKSYVTIKAKNTLAITANNYDLVKPDQTINCIFFTKLLCSKISPSLIKYLPEDIKKALANIETIDIVATKNKELIVLKALFVKKKNDLPIIAW